MVYERLKWSIEHNEKTSFLIESYLKKYKPFQLVRPEFKAYASTKIHGDFSKFFVCFWMNFAIVTDLSMLERKGKH